MEMKAKPKISIIVPVFNGERTIRSCMDSILNQTCRDLEIIVVDDGSYDNSFFICEDYRKRDSRVKVYHQNNRGTMEAIAKGIDESAGKYIGFVDSDDWIEADAYRHMLDVAENNDADLIQCGILHDFENQTVKHLGIEEDTIFLGQEIIEVLGRNLLNFWETGGIYFPPSRCNKLIKSELVRSNMKYCDTSLKMGEDLNMILPILIDCKKIMCLNECYYHYVLNRDSTTQNHIENLRINNSCLFQAIEEICRIKEVDLSRYTKKYYNYMTILAVFNEAESRESFGNKMYNTIAICRENPGKKTLKELYSPDLYKLKKLTISLMILRLYFLIPFLLKLHETIKKTDEAPV